MRAARLVFATAFLLVPFGCGSDNGGGASSHKCTTGQQSACACPGSTMGVQVCQGDGSFGACSCGSGGGSGGTGMGGTGNIGKGGSGGSGASSGAATGGSVAVGGKAGGGTGGTGAMSDCYTDRTCQSVVDCCDDFTYVQGMSCVAGDCCMSHHTPCSESTECCYGNECVNGVCCAGLGAACRGGGDCCSPPEYEHAMACLDTCQHTAHGTPCTNDDHCLYGNCENNLCCGGLAATCDPGTDDCCAGFECVANAGTQNYYCTVSSP